MNDRHAQFLIAVGDLCTAAGLAGLEVQVRLSGDGERAVRGVPGPQLAGGEAGQISDTGYAGTIVVDDHIIALEDLEACTIYAPRGPVAVPGPGAA